MLRTGDKYEGQWKGGKQDGHGTFTFTDGAMLVASCIAVGAWIVVELGAVDRGQIQRPMGGRCVLRGQSFDAKKQVWASYVVT